ncbi:tetratricopeptide repeat-containing sensor histidine kinase [Leeuwenhoekiella marinoflava]|uniref:histidine kinase n=2 Tax=Leeuwenhoekiella marinoflava TaxID=988 RepID=A0A4Q0PL09_9FLAO|nr:tetratricopeptide repeat-containing sensor histidine kinase [Leeuwenhoekiella marinoflava]RXG29178.1 signal transduction histidine kinase [Leeuwenhoekiella marinoflava]SHF34175.1 Signal transduction histidine kinase [Leeuwenhoekiella marinoflava DSM 3653]
MFSRIFSIINIFSSRNLGKFAFFYIVWGFLGCSKQPNTNFATIKDDLDTFKESIEEVENLDDSIVNDSLRLSILSRLSLKFLYSDSTVFRHTNRKTITLSSQLANKKILANAYWDLAYFYSNNSYLDSAYASYYKAYQNFRSIGDGYHSGKMMLNMAISQERARDYIGSENSSFRALKLLPDHKKKDIYAVYNNLAIIYNGLDDFDSAITNHKKAIDIATRIGDQSLIVNSLNNIAVVYIENGFYAKALEYIVEALKTEDLKNSDTRLYAMILDNYSYAQFKQGNTEDFLEYSLEALRIRDSIDHKAGIMANKIRLAEYYLFEGDSTNSQLNLKSALSLAEDEKNSKYELEALLKLQKITKNQEYLDRYITLNDKLIREERNIRSKFARIRYETNTYIQENKNLNERNIWLTITSITMLALVCVIFFSQRQRIKLREAQMQNKLKDSNEEVLNLLLDQQNKVELAEITERQRISRDLHDGILSRLFGTRMALGFLIRQDSNNSAKNHVEELQAIEKDIRNVSHNLISTNFDSNDGVEKLIKKLIQDFNDHSDIDFDLEISKEVNFNNLESSIKISIYYILQESLQNVRKHSLASSCLIKFTIELSNLKLIVHDDGIGFDAKTPKQGIGLKNLHYRINNFKGRMYIESDASGTKITYSIPI